MSAPLVERYAKVVPHPGWDVYFAMRYADGDVEEASKLLDRAARIDKEVLKSLRAAAASNQECQDALIAARWDPLEARMRLSRAKMRRWFLLYPFYVVYHFCLAWALLLAVCALVNFSWWSILVGLAIGWICLGTWWHWIFEYRGERFGGVSLLAALLGAGVCYYAVRDGELEWAFRQVPPYNHWKYQDYPILFSGNGDIGVDRDRPPSKVVLAEWPLKDQELLAEGSELRKKAEDFIVSGITPHSFSVEQAKVANRLLEIGFTLNQKYPDLLPGWVFQGDALRILLQTPSVSRGWRNEAQADWLLGKAVDNLRHLGGENDERTAPLLQGLSALQHERWKAVR